MSMDLWYDLAARELPDLAESVIEKLEGMDALSHAVSDAEPEEAEAAEVF